MIGLLVLPTFSAMGLVQYGSGKQGQELLRSKVRRSILSFLRSRPAASITELCEGAQLSWSSAQHHLYLLQQAGLVQSERVGRALALFARDGSPVPAHQAALLHRGKSGEIARLVLLEPGVQQKDVCERLGITRKVFRHHVDLLIQAGLVQEHAGPKRRTYDAAGPLRGLGAPGAADAPVRIPGPWGKRP